MIRLNLGLLSEKYPLRKANDPPVTSNPVLVMKNGSSLFSPPTLTSDLAVLTSAVKGSVELYVPLMRSNFELVTLIKVILLNRGTVLVAPIDAFDKLSIKIVVCFEPNSVNQPLMISSF